MRILIVAPPADGAVTGNSLAAEAWADSLQETGHQVAIAPRFESQPAELMIALNAHRSAGSVEAFRAAHPAAGVIVVLTGTDIHPRLSGEALGALRAADRVVALQDRAREHVPAEFHDKLRVIHQAAVAPDQPAGERVKNGEFTVAVVANLRAVKDPLVAALAARRLPADSRVRILHAGWSLDPDLEARARAESESNPRYQWLGGLDAEDALQLIARSDLLALTSRSEGAGRVVGEAAVCGTPVLSTRIDGVVGLLGGNYPGYFPVGDDKALARLLRRAETDPDFYDELRVACGREADRFDPAREGDAWRRLVDEFEPAS